MMKLTSLYLSAACYALVTAQTPEMAPEMSVEVSPETGALGNATVVENNPPGVTYIAVLPNLPNMIKGSMSATANPDGIGVKFNVNFSNFPAEGGPFLYHLHVAPVPSDGNCTGTLGHLDPFIRGEQTPCLKSLPQTCQVGDLSGKHSKIEADPFEQTYTDIFASTFEGVGSFFGNRSVVIHFANKTRIACANFTLADAQGSTTNSTPSTGNGSSPVPFTGSSSRLEIVSATSFLFLIQLMLLI